MEAGAKLGTIETKIPTRLDRLPWAGFHWRVMFGLGIVWIIDGLEVTIVGFLAPTLVDPDSGIAMTNAHIALAQSIYIAGACSGALFFGQLTDRFGRKNLFIITLLVYLVATLLTAIAWAPWWFLAMRFFTGAGIGGEYAAINSAIDELIPARARGRVDLIINGSFWIGAVIGGLGSLVLLNEAVFDLSVGWRVAFALGATLALAIVFVRRQLPESPRWLFIHGREDEAEGIVDGIERAVAEDADRELEEPEDSITVRQRRTIPFREIARTAFKLYPKRTTLGLSLFVGQSFLYNAVTITLGLTLTTYFGVASSNVGLFYAVFAAGNFLGPVLLGRLFDTVGRKPMITGTYLLSAAMLAVVGLGIGTCDPSSCQPQFSGWTLVAALGATFFFASAGASSAYLTVSEIFPMEVRALAIAFFYAFGTAIGGIIGPQVFERLGSIDTDGVMLAYLIGAGVMSLGGIGELVLGVRAEQTQLEDIAKPLTARDAEQQAKEGEGAEAERPPEEGRPAEPREAPEAEEADAEARERAERRRAVEERRRRRRERERAGWRRFRPGPGSHSYSPFFGHPATMREEWLDEEVAIIGRALSERGEASRRELAQSVGAPFWGPGRFPSALRAAIAEDVARRSGRRRYARGEAPLE